MKTALVLGAGGFIGSHLVNRLKSEGYWVRGVDLKYPEYSPSQADEMLIYDLRDPRNVEAVMRLEFDINNAPFLRIVPFSYSISPFTVRKGFDEVYQLAADMGGAQFVFSGEHDADIMHNSALINLNVCHYAREYNIGKIFYSSSACMYPQELQADDKLPIEFGETIPNYNLAEYMAYPANPDSEYGWEKLFSERLYLAYCRNYGLNIRIARFHNIYGPEGTYKGGREKAPAAMCRKAIEAPNDHMSGIHILGDGKQTRSFLYIDDCIDAVRLLMESDFKEPINIGSEEMVSIYQLAKMALTLANKEHIGIWPDASAKAVGVRGRNSDNTLMRKELDWEPKYSLKEGLTKTFNWIKSQYEKD